MDAMVTEALANPCFADVETVEEHVLYPHRMAKSFATPSQFDRERLEYHAIVHMSSAQEESPNGERQRRCQAARRCLQLT